MLRNQFSYILAPYLLVGSVYAGDYDGSKILICAPANTLSCEPATGCTRGEAVDVNLPRFIKIDVNSKTVSAVGGERSTEILHVGHDDEELILQGSENGRGWSAVISEATGDMTITSAGQNRAFVVFGACMVSE